LILLSACGACGPKLRQVSTDRSVPFAASEALACVEFQPQVVYRNNGYDHIVHLRSRCDRATACSVATDVNPTPADVAVPPREQIAVLTFRGSPAREFTPHVSCRFGS
jgi:hypothetical protein